MSGIVMKNVVKITHEKHGSLVRETDAFAKLDHILLYSETCKRINISLTNIYI